MEISDNCKSGSITHTAGGTAVVQAAELTSSIENCFKVEIRISKIGNSI